MVMLLLQILGIILLGIFVIALIFALIFLIAADIEKTQEEHRVARVKYDKFMKEMDDMNLPKPKGEVFRLKKNVTLNLAFTIKNLTPEDFKKWQEFFAGYARSLAAVMKREMGQTPEINISCEDPN